MPIYEYECTKCGAVTEAIRPMRDADAAIACDKCGGATSRKHSVFMTAAAKDAASPASRGGDGLRGCGPGCGCHPH